MIDQIGIALTGVTAIFLTQSKTEKLRRYACLFGLAGQPFWIYSALAAHQWGVLALTVLYTLAWWKGVWTHWIKPRVAADWSHPLSVRAYVMSEPHLSGWRVILGFAHRDDADAAHAYVANVGRRSPNTSSENAP